VRRLEEDTDVTPRLSVVVPFYNVADYIHDCLDSIARQTYADFEAILVDDGSLDESGAIAKEFCSHDPRFRIVAQENQGLGPARNTGVQHAQGEFVCFVDSDDLVTRHAYEKMLATLDRTGSSFVAGNARRFNNSSGVRQSWVQRIPFAKERLATHVTDFPQLVLDRMVWNKVYRRSFWDEFGYRFPAIRYEDYPVTLKAHLDAVTVDCLSTPVYYWRERESGESITQQKFKYSNIHDRVVSAELVMDLVDERAPELRTEVHRHLAEIDLVVLVQAFGSVPDDQLGNLVGLSKRLTTRLDPRVEGELSSYDRLQLHALRSGEVDLLRRLADFRADGGLRGGARARRRPLKPWVPEHDYPGLNDADLPVPRDLYRIPPDALSLWTAVSNLSWDGGDLVVRGTAEIHHLRTGSRSRLRMSLVAEDVRIPLDVRRYRAADSHGDEELVGYEIRITPAMLARLPMKGTPAQVKVEMSVGRIRREARLHGLHSGSPGWSPGGWLTDGVWIQPASSNGRLSVKRLANPWRLTETAVKVGAFTVSGWLPAGIEEPKLVLNRTLSGEDLEIDLELQRFADGTLFSAEIPMTPILDDANPDDPFTQRTSRGLHLASANQGSRMLLWTGAERAVHQVHTDRLLLLSRSPGNYANLHESPIRLFADTARHPAGDRVELSGPQLAPDRHTFVWRRFLADSDDYVDVPCTSGYDHGRWTAAIETTELLTAQAADALQSANPDADWALFAVAEDGTAQAVQTEAFLNSRLPLTVERPAARAWVRPRAGTLHLEVR
jgi:glycosyltransferase involved in cell wall biosynthesis